MSVLLAFVFLLSELLKLSREKPKTGVRAHDRIEKNDPPKDRTEKTNGKQHSTCQSSPHAMSSSREVHEPHTTDHDSKAQYGNNERDWLDYAFFIATVVAAGGAVAAAIFTGWQASIAKQELNASQRPWVGVEIIDYGGVEIDKTFRFALRLHNYGRTPAVRVHITHEGVLWQPGSKHNVLETQKEMCKIGSMDQPYGFGPYVLFPDQEHIENTGMGIFDNEGVQKSLDEAPRIRDSPSVFLFPYITGCITYQSTFENAIHRTPFTVQITRRGIPEAKDNSPELNAIRIDKGPIPASMISLRSESGIQPD